MINSRSVALSFPKQMSGFRNSSSRKAAKGFATASKSSTSSSALLLHLTSPPTCSGVSRSFSLPILFITCQILLKFVRIFSFSSEVTLKPGARWQPWCGAEMCLLAQQEQGRRKRRQDLPCAPMPVLHFGSVVKMKPASRDSWNQTKPQRSEKRSSGGTLQIAFYLAFFMIKCEQLIIQAN